MVQEDKDRDNRGRSREAEGSNNTNDIVRTSDEMDGDPVDRDIATRDADGMIGSERATSNDAADGMVGGSAGITGAADGGGTTVGGSDNLERDAEDGMLCGPAGRTGAATKPGGGANAEAEMDAEESAKTGGTSTLDREPRS